MVIQTNLIRWLHLPNNGDEPPLLNRLWLQAIFIFECNDCTRSVFIFVEWKIESKDFKCYKATQTLITEEPSGSWTEILKFYQRLRARTEICNVFDKLVSNSKQNFKWFPFQFNKCMKSFVHWNSVRRSCDQGSEMFCKQQQIKV